MCVLIEAWSMHLISHHHGLLLSRLHLHHGLLAGLHLHHRLLLTWLHLHHWLLSRLHHHLLLRIIVLLLDSAFWGPLEVVVVVDNVCSVPFLRLV